MSTEPPSSTLPDHVERIAASVVGFATRRHRASGLVWRPGVAVGSAAMLWRHPRVSIALADGEQVDGDVRGLDGGTDLAVVAFAGVAAPSVERSAAPPPRVGDAVFAVGRDPSGLMHASFGHVGAVGGEWRTWRGGRLEQLIRLDGGLPPGLVGAPVADSAGRILGIVSHSFSRHHAVVVPVATIERVIDPLLTHGRLPQGYLGIAVQAVRATMDGTGVDGLLVTSLAADGPAARGGLLVGDVIVTLAGQPAASLDALRSQLQVGATVQAVIVRGGQRHELALEVIQRPGSFCG
jgi:S1-C subfamily serine protease